MVFQQWIPNVFLRPPQSSWGTMGSLSPYLDFVFVKSPNSTHGYQKSAREILKVWLRGTKDTRKMIPTVLCGGCGNSFMQEYITGVVKIACLLVPKRCCLNLSILLTIGQTLDADILTTRQLADKYEYVGRGNITTRQLVHTCLQRDTRDTRDTRHY